MPATPDPQPTRESALVRIWSDEHFAYWRPDGCGYTTRAPQAGIFTLDEAKHQTRHCGPEKKIILEPATDIDRFAARRATAAPVLDNHKFISGLPRPVARSLNQKDAEKLAWLRTNPGTDTKFLLDLLDCANPDPQPTREADIDPDPSTEADAAAARALSKFAYLHGHATDQYPSLRRYVAQEIDRFAAQHTPDPQLTREALDVVCDVARILNADQPDRYQRAADLVWVFAEAVRDRFAVQHSTAAPVSGDLTNEFPSE